MKNILLVAVSTSAMMTLVNYGFQAVRTPHEWGVAFERSFFQITGIVAMTLTYMWYVK